MLMDVSFNGSEAWKATAGFAEENCLFFDLQCSSVLDKQFSLCVREVK